MSMHIENLSQDEIAALLNVMKGDPIEGTASWSGGYSGAPQFAWDNDAGCVFGCYIDAHDGLIEIAVAAEAIQGMDDIEQRDPVVYYAEAGEADDWQQAAITFRSALRGLRLEA